MVVVLAVVVSVPALPPEVAVTVVADSTALVTTVPVALRLPCDIEGIIKDLCDIDLSPGTIISPDKFELLFDIIEFNLI